MIFNFNALRSYMWDIVMEHIENNYLINPTANYSINTRPHNVLGVKFTDNIPRDLSKPLSYYQNLQASLHAGSRSFAWSYVI